MEYFPAPLEKLVEQFARLPGVGYKSAQRLAFHVLSLPAEEAQAQFRAGPSRAFTVYNDRGPNAFPSKSGWIPTCRWVSYSAADWIPLWSVLWRQNF